MALLSDLPSGINLVIWWWVFFFFFFPILPITSQLEVCWLFEQGFHTAGTVKLLFYFSCVWRVLTRAQFQGTQTKCSPLIGMGCEGKKTTRWVILLFSVWKFTHLTIGLTARVIKGTWLKFRTLLSQPEELEIRLTQVLGFTSAVIPLCPVNVRHYQTDPHCDEQSWD